MCIKTNLLFIDKLKKLNVIDDNIIIVLNYFSYNGNAIYDELIEFVKDTNLIIACDGLEIKF
jgi:hypothetical protein